MDGGFRIRSVRDDPPLASTMENAERASQACILRVAVEVPRGVEEVKVTGLMRRVLRRINMERRGDERAGQVPSTWGDGRLRHLFECLVRHGSQGSARGDCERRCSSRRLAGCLGFRRSAGGSSNSDRVPPVAVVTKDSSSLDTKLSTPEISPELGAAASRAIASRRIRDFIWQSRFTITKPNTGK